MDEAELKNWESIKTYFESLPEDKRDNFFYKRAVAIASGQPDPLPPVEKEDKNN